jgi:hypothetical protein
MITAIELAKKVSEMRETQKKYFKTRDVHTLEKSKRLEKQVDKMTCTVFTHNPVPGSLFDTPKA